MSFSISGNAGIASASVSWTGPSSGSVTADSLGNYLIAGLAPGVYTITPSHAARAFNPTSQFITVSNINIVAVNFLAVSTSTPASGFGCSFIAQNTAELTVFVSAGQIKGTNVNSRAVAVPADAQTYIWVDNVGNVLAGAGLPPGVYAIALVTTGDVQTSGTGNPNSGAYILSPGVLSIQDLRS
jgi:hypothetical protein